MNPVRINRNCKMDFACWNTVPQPDSRNVRKVIDILNSPCNPVGLIRGYSLDRTESQAANELFLTEPAQYQDWRDGHRRCGAEFGIEQSLGA